MPSTTWLVIYFLDKQIPDSGTIPLPTKVQVVSDFLCSQAVKAMQDRLFLQPFPPQGSTTIAAA